MSNLAKKQQPQRESTQDHGTVIRTEGQGFIIETEAGEIRARRATSCLLEPLPSDLVLVATLSFGASYVLAVLEREEGAPGSLVVDGDLDITSRRGEVSVAAPEGVRLVSTKEVSVVAGALRVNAVDGNVALQRLSFLGQFLRAEVGKAKVFGQSFDAVLDRFSQRVKRSFRVVEGCDHVRAEQIDYAAKSSLSLHGQNALVTAECLAKIEGDQIHLG